MSHRILIVDDERALREELAEFFHDQNLYCAIAGDAEQALKLVREQDFDIVLTDIRMPGIDGIELACQLRDVAPEALVLMMTAHPSVDTAVSAMRIGVIDYVIKPLVLQDLLRKVRHLIEFKEQQRELRWYRQQAQANHDVSNIVGRSKPMREVFSMLKKVAENRTPVLITGESGTGKELVARAIHYHGARKDERFVTVNCSAIPAALIEAELFGHMKGAFTGAEHDRKGLFAVASGGTLFLDELGELPLEQQPKLLRATENQEILPVGADKTVSVDTRIVASTNKDLRLEVQEGRFREDLYYRVSVVTIHMPPLRDRREDIPRLVDRFVGQFNRELKRQVTGLSNEALRRLLSYEWKGNVRELRNVIERAVMFTEGDLITPDVLPTHLMEATHPAETTGTLRDAVHR
ncbi:MAG: sigma-54-dependent Fis family transcriptional regulator, partial [Planctomycetes bacterium]|nr:sigma-54-dependent Fis family transcriptional regulator [Planctomycetota bacterium]